ncbi:MAG: DUF6095 family protein [Flavobacteriaceae bacterium]|nr:DUF6095 family protein [Flavobacteriaceae bacterium]
MNTALLSKGLKRVAGFIVLAFTGPVVIYQAFQNEGHPFYYPVLILGLILCGLSIGLGFWGIRTLTAGLLGPRPKKKNS